MQTQIIMISGKQGAGKSTLVKELELLLEAPHTLVAEVRFASTIYAIHDFCNTLMNSLGFEVQAKDGRLLQLLGTEWGRKTFGDDVWVRALRGHMQILETQALSSCFQRLVLLISDCRFQSEFNAFPEALRVRLECPREIRKFRCDGWRDADQHQSEIDLDDYVTDGRFDMIFNSYHQQSKPIAEQVVAMLGREKWVEERHPVMR